MGTVTMPYSVPSVQPLVFLCGKDQMDCSFDCSSTPARRRTWARQPNSFAKDSPKFHGPFIVISFWLFILKS